MLINKNHKNELSTKITLGAVTILSEISIIFIIRLLPTTQYSQKKMKNYELKSAQNVENNFWNIFCFF